MSIIEYFKKKKNSKIESRLIKKETSIIQTKPNKKIKNLKDFIQYSLINNGGDYQDIYQKLLAMSEFSKHAQEYGVKCNLTKVDEALNDFFSIQSEIKYYPIKNIPYTAFYTKKDGWNRYNYRGVSVLQDEQAKRPVLYFGRRNEKAETHKKDCVFCFGENTIILRNQYNANYDEFPLWGDGTHAEFTFDRDNKIVKVAYRYMTEPRLGFWSKEHICEFDSEINQYKVLQPPVLEESNNDPKPTRTSMRKFTETLLK